MKHDKKKYSTLLYIFLLVTFSCVSSKQGEILNKRIAIAQKSFIENGSLKNEIIANEFNRLRKIFISELPIDSLNTKNKYILFESFDSQSAIYEMSLYSSDVSFDLKYFAPYDSLSIQKTSPTYSSFINSNILKENFKKISKRQEEQGPITGGVRVYTYLIKWRNNKLGVIPFSFDEFHDAISEMPLQ